MIWLGPERGDLFDWITQRWVQFAGRRVSLAARPWLAGPVAPTTGIGADYFEAWARGEGLRRRRAEGATGILPDFAALAGASFEPGGVDPVVVRFYEETSAYELDAWAEWCGLFRPFGRALAALFSRRLQQLNVPLSGLDTSRGMTSEVLQFADADADAGTDAGADAGSGPPRHTAWFRRLRGSGDVLYAGFYSVCTLPGRADPCVKVVFPLPNGNAIVVMRTEGRPDGSFVVTSAGDGFGEPGFYFTVRAGGGAVWARYVRSLRESIHVYAAGDGAVRADHRLTCFGATFLRLHYRMRRPGVRAS